MSRKRFIPRAVVSRLEWLTMIKMIWINDNDKNWDLIAWEREKGIIKRTVYSGAGEREVGKVLDVYMADLGWI